MELWSCQADSEEAPTVDEVQSQWLEDCGFTPGSLSGFGDLDTAASEAGWKIQLSPNDEWLGSHPFDQDALVE
jgi:hypothetical protein